MCATAADIHVFDTADTDRLNLFQAIVAPAHASFYSIPLRFRVVNHFSFKRFVILKLKKRKLEVCEGFFSGYF